MQHIASSEPSSTPPAFQAPGCRQKSAACLLQASQNVHCMGDSNAMLARALRCLQTTSATAAAATLLSPTSSHSSHSHAYSPCHLGGAAARCHG